MNDDIGSGDDNGGGGGTGSGDGAVGGAVAGETVAGERRWRPSRTYPEPPQGWTGGSPLEAFIDAMIDLGQTGQIFGEHGIGKTATFVSHVRRTYQDTELVYVPAANLAPDDLLVNAPVRDAATGELVLRQLVMRQLKPGRRFVLLIDDSLQAGPAIQSQLMQIACNWSLGEHDLRALGCIGVFLADNETLSETSARRSDFAILDRMVTMKVGANDTGWRISLAERFRDKDLSEVFRIWSAQVPEIRRLLSPRTLEHVIANGLEGFPLAWGLPILNGERLRLVIPADQARPEQDRTRHILDSIAAALGVANPSTIADPVRRVLRAALRNRWCVLIQGPPGCGKTEIVKELVRSELRRDPLYFSLPVTNVEDLCAPVPMVDGTLDNLLSAGFTGDDPKAIVWDEYNRPKDKAAFARLMEITQEWSIAGRPIRNLRAQIALQNPPYHVGRKLLVARNNIAQASRFTASLDVRPEDIPANEWLIEKYGPVAETVLEWWKNDIDEEGRAWITKRTLERLIRLHQRGLPLQQGLVYLGDGEFAPVPLGDLIVRLKGRQRTGLRELAKDLDAWERRLRAAMAAGSEGSDASDVVHQIFANAELSQLRAHTQVVIRLLPWLPSKLRATYFVGASEEASTFWVGMFAACQKKRQ